MVGSAFVIVWASAVAVVLLETRDFSALPELVLASAAFGLAVRPVFRIRAAATTAGLVVDNGFRARFLPWSAVSLLRIESSSFSGRVVAVLRSGRRVPLRATFTIGPAARRRRRLRAMHEVLSAPAPDEDPGAAPAPA
jgi:hypothetical protein